VQNRLGKWEALQVKLQGGQKAWGTRQIKETWCVNYNQVGKGHKGGGLFVKDLV